MPDLRAADNSLQQRPITFAPLVIFETLFVSHAQVNKVLIKNNM